MGANSGNIREIEINPENPNQLFIASDYGIYRTNNATSSNPTWIKVLNGNPGVDDAEFKGLEFKPDDTTTIYASGQDIYRSTDGGTTWLSMTIGTNLDLENMLDPLDPPGPNNEESYYLDRINITTTPASPERVYAYISGTEYYWDTNDLSTTNTSFIYMFDGTDWVLLNGDFNGGSSGWLAIAVSPVDENAVYYGTTKLYGNNDITSQSFVPYSTYESLGRPFHVDIHSLEFQPNTTNPKLFCGNDGGISVRTDTPPLIGKYNWEARCRGLGVSTLWSFDDSESNEEYILAGFQDDGSKKMNGFDNWSFAVSFGDGYGAQISDLNDQTAFSRNNKWLHRYDYKTNYKFTESSNCQKPYNVNYYGNCYEIIDYRPYDPISACGINNKAFLTIDFEIKNEPKSGEMFWTFSEIYKRKKEIAEPNIDNHNPDNLWEIKSNLSDFENLEASWKRQINRFEISEADPNYRYFIRMGGFPIPPDDPIYPYPTRLFRVTDGSNNYEELVIPGFVNKDDYTLASDIVVDPEDPQHIWLSLTGFKENYRVWYSEDAGDTWSNADPNNDLPRLPVNAITYQKGSDDILYIATDVGVYVKNGSNASWEKYGNCPNVVVQDLKINYCNNKLRIATFGRGVWQADIIETEGDLPEIAYSPGDINLWDTEVDRGLRNNVRIESGHTFTIQGNISMPRNGKITVEPGAKLIIDGGKLTNNCGGQWQGIHVLGNKNLPQTEANQGVVEVINGGTIENAAYGIYAGNPDNVVDNETGGIIRVENAVFINNRVAIYIPSYTESENQSYIYNSSFTTTPEYYALENSNTSVRPFIELWDTGSIDIQGNTFENTCVMGVEAPVHKQGVGIHTVDADMTVTPFGENPNEFINLYKGIDIEDTSDGSTNDINNNVFTGCVIGLHLNNANHVSFTENQIDLYNDTHLGDPHKPTGLYITQAQGFHIEANEIADSSTTTPNETVGIYVRDCSSENQFYRNFFTNLDIGVFAEGSNIGPSITEYGLRILCNEFDEVDHDIYVAPVSWIAFD